MEDKMHSCAFCGEAIARAPYARRGKEYCCEGCFLKQKEFQTLREERNEAYLALPEALIAALDEREHKTGLHSKRVACHTLVLARRFTDDPEVLRQILLAQFGEEYHIYRLRVPGFIPRWGQWRNLFTMRNITPSVSDPTSKSELAENSDSKDDSTNKKARP